MRTSMPTEKHNYKKKNKSMTWRVMTESLLISVLTGHVFPHLVNSISSNIYFKYTKKSG